MTGFPSLEGAVTGVTSNSVPYVALPPEGNRGAQGLIILWHGADPPRNEMALAGALALSDVPAWRVYLGLPLSGQRMPAGGPEELMQRGAGDAVTLLFHPIIKGAVDELPAAVVDLRAQLEIDPRLPLGIFGFSMGGSAALLTLARKELRFHAAVTLGAVSNMRSLVDFISSMYGATYEWIEDRLRLAQQISALNCGREIARSGANVLLAIGSEDPNPIRDSMAQLASDITRNGGNAQFEEVADVKHGFVDEPGIEVVPQGSQAKAIEHVASEWFRRFLS